jgi:hypothetical protein
MASLLSFPEKLTKDSNAMTNLRMAALLALVMISAATPPAYGGGQESPDKVAPQGQDKPGADDGGNPPPPAEDKGVIPPPPTGDTGIQTQVPNPNAGTPEEVIPPPGTPGGNPNVEPR